MRVRKTLDCKGLSCPEPILRIKKTMSEMNAGEILEMQATDPASAPDMAAWSRRTGNKIVEEKQEGDVYIYYIEKS